MFEIQNYLILFGSFGYWELEFIWDLEFVI